MHTPFWLKVPRIEALTDGIFAISMTLVVLSIEVPDVPRENADEALRQILSDNWHQLEHYALSFVLLAAFWISHHRQFHFIRRANETFLWLNIVVLMFIALVPFTTSFMSTYNDYQIPNLVFQANLMAIGLLYLGMWRYATHGYRLVDRAELDRRHVSMAALMTIVTPVLSLIAMAMTFFSPSYSEVAYMLAPFAIAVLRRAIGESGTATSH